MKALLTFLSFILMVSFGHGQTCEALFTFDATPITIHFEDISTHAPNDPIVSWDWDFDDGTGSSQQHPIHTFPAPDRYDVNLTITTQNGCSSNIEIRIEICDFGVNYNIGACNANNMVPVTFNITDIYDNADEIDVILDGQSVPGSPFEIDGQNPVNVTVLVPGNGLLHTINIQSTDIETCGRTIEFTTEDCSSDCFLGSLFVEFAGGVTHNVTVGNDFFSPQSIAIELGDVVHFTWQGSGHSTTSDATSGPDAWNSGVIGAGSTFDVNIHNPGTHNYYCQPHGGPNGVGMSGQILSNCPGGSTLPLTVHFNATVANPAGYNVLWDNVPVPGSPFDYNGVGMQSVTINIAGDGLAHTLIVRDVADPTCDIDLNYNAPDCNQGGGTPVCSISGTVGNFGGCNNNNVTATLTVNVTNGGTGFNVSIDNGPNTFYSYTGNTTTVTITLPGNGGNHTVEITDNVDPACTATINVTTPNCNLPCSITNLTATAASGNGGPSGIVHTVNVQDFQFNPNVVNITVGDIVQWVWTGAIAHTSTSDATSGPNSWDSGLLNNGATYNSPLLSEGTHPYYCEPHGAPGGVGMAGTIFVLPPCNANGETNVLVEFDITSNGTQGFQVLVDGVVVGTFPYVGGTAQSATVLVPGDAMSHTITVRDVANQSCSATTTVTTPDCGGGGTPVCTISVTASIAGGCTNNNIPVSLDVNATNNGASFTVTVDGNSAGTYSYNAPTVIVNVPGDGNSHTIVVTDIDDPTCTASTQITTPNCSLPCSITNLTATASSGSGGPSGIVHTVNVEDFQFNPDVVNITVGDVVQWVWTGAIAHTSTSDAPSGPNSWNSGLLNNGATYTSPLLSEGTHPYYCVPHGAPGGVGMAGTVYVLPPCNANDETNVLVTFNVQSNGNSGFQVLVDGTVAGTFPYAGGSAQSATVLVPGDAMSHSIMVRDVANQSCNATTTVTTPDCGGGGTPVCSISVTASVAGGCSNNTVPVSLDVNANNNGASFIVFLDGNNVGTYSYTAPTVTINVPGDGNAHTIVVTDIDDPACTASTTITTPNCTLPCSITNLTANVAGGNGGPSGIEHTVNVEDFQFNPNVVNITVGDVVKWIWTGNIPHTSTSDISGTPNSWDSGLLGNGATYTSPVLDEGEYGYYCIPHGAPGGIGMSGTIHVLPPCNNFGQTTVQVNFNATNGGNAGYSVIVDGNNAGNFQYVPGTAQSASVLVAGNGLPHTIVVQDISNQSCSASVTVTTPDCSGGGNAECMISLSPAISGGCNNGMVAVTLNVAGVNNSTTYNVSVDGQSAGTFNYSNAGASVNIIGNGLPHTIVITDSGDPTCTALATITTTNCSLPCSITISEISFGENISHTVQVQDFQYSPEEITINLGDTINFVWTGVIPHTVTSDAPTGPNAFNSGLLGQGSTWQLIPNATGAFPYYCIPHGAPGGVGMSGIINVTSSCDGNLANGTMVINYSGSSGLGFIVTQDGNPVTGSPFAYSPTGTLTIPLSVNGDGSLHTFVVTDAGVATCSASQSVTVPSCNPSCTLNITQAAVSGCAGNTVTLTVSFTSNQVNATYNVYKDGLKLNPNPLTTDANGNGNYSTMIVGNGTNAIISVQFIENGSCSSSQSVTIPSCAGPCLINDFVVGQGAGTHIVEVKDFVFSPASINVLLGDTIHFVWTGAIPHTTTSDQFSGPNSWNSGLLGQGSTYDLVINDIGSFPYYCQPHGGPGGIGMSGVINVMDTCDLETWMTNISFNVSAGSPLGYNVFVDGVKVTDTPIQYDNPVGYNEEIIGLPGDGAWHLVTIQDLETGFCAYTQPVQTSICGAGCSVVNLTANTGSNILHTVEVRDFDYLPQHITVGAGETIRFVWTGEIPHTVTSDAVSGPEVFNSGLLSQGATYDLVINTPGVHPYFCIPHGGPGGIGMSGTITVLPACADNKQNVQVQFEVTNGSLFGYNVFVDGTLYGNNPHAYDDRTGANEILIAYPADNSQHIITIQDLQNNICAASEFFTMGTCNADCELSGIDYFLGNGRRHDILVRDFDYLPANIQVELGDTVHFVWTGVIPHTVTSDKPTGPDSFNSGLLGQGAEYNVVLATTGTHPYYCIPHGAPGGLGMAGVINVVDPCDDGKVFVDFRFFSEGVGTSYDVSNNANVVINDHAYAQGGIQAFSLELDAQGQSHQIVVSDNGPDDCTISLALDSFDCNDPCFLVRANFSYDINFSLNEVAFTDKSKGDIVSWNWNFGDGGTSTLENPTHTFPEATLYEVCLTVTDANGCVETFCDKLRLGSNVCHAAFTYEQNGLEFIFHNTSDVSEPTVTATWTFGDGMTSTQYDLASHTYALGLYEVCLTVTASGCVNTHCEILDLTNPCLALRSKYEATVENGNPLQYQFTDQSTGPVGSRLWGFGDGQISTEDNPTHTYTSIGVYTVCLLVLDDAGNCTDSDCRTLYVGTTGIDPVEVQLKKITVVPNPVSISAPEVTISGFDLNDIGRKSKVIIHDITGMRMKEIDVILEAQNSITLPEIPGVYYLQVVTELNRYGAMIAVQ